MFAIYRETAFNRRYRVVYFTELDEKGRDAEINAMLDGDPFYEGFISGNSRRDAKEVISTFLAQLNDGADRTPSELERALTPFLSVEQGEA